MDILVGANAASLPIIPLTTLARYTQDAWLSAWFNSNQFTAKAGQICLVPAHDSGRLAQVFVGVDVQKPLWSLAGLPAVLPEGQYHIEDPEKKMDLELAVTGFMLAHYQFDRYKKKNVYKAQLCVDTALLKAVPPLVEAITLVRDLINVPAEDMGPDMLAEEAGMLASDFAASCTTIVGEQLLAKNYPAIYMVGRAGQRAPRLIDLQWGNPEHPKVTLVGKGVCFDTGGLNIKPADGMLLQKKDMAGAAHALGLARLILQKQLPIRLRVLIPTVENAIAGNAYRPGDVLHTRKGLTVEITNTDAEGRLILADALAEACADKPELLLDFATLTGAGRVALGTELPALYSNRDALAREVMACGEKCQDSLWQMPLFADYKEMNHSKIADLVNCASGSYGGSVTAALFLQEFVDPAVPWMHIDFMAWNLKNKPGRPEGGEAMGLRALFAYLLKRYAE